MTGNVSIAQWEKYEGDDWWSWAVWIEGAAADLALIECVEWRLHPTFPKPIRKVSDRKSKFRLETAGWGGFTIVAYVERKSAERIKLVHELALNYPSGEATTA